MMPTLVTIRVFDVVAQHHWRRVRRMPAILARSPGIFTHRAHSPRSRSRNPFAGNCRPPKAVLARAPNSVAARGRLHLTGILGALRAGAAMRVCGATMWGPKGMFATSANSVAQVVQSAFSLCPVVNDVSNCRCRVGSESPMASRGQEYLSGFLIIVDADYFPRPAIVVVSESGLARYLNAWGTNTAHSTCPNRPAPREIAK